MKIGIASDHHGLDKVEKIKEYLEGKGYTVINYGPTSGTATDYPHYAFEVSHAVAAGTVDKGILMCGTGIGMSIAANKVHGIRCARIVSVDDAMYASLHNHANVVALSAHLDLDLIEKMIDKYLETAPSMEERHVRRVSMIDEYHD